MALAVGGVYAAEQDLFANCKGATWEKLLAVDCHRVP
jgi:hypothetical protein